MENHKTFPQHGKCQAHTCTRNPCNLSDRIFMLTYFLIVWRLNVGLRCISERWYIFGEDGQPLDIPTSIYCLTNGSSAAVRTRKYTMFYSVFLVLIHMSFKRKSYKSCLLETKSVYFTQYTGYNLFFFLSFCWKPFTFRE